MSSNCKEGTKVGGLGMIRKKFTFSSCFGTLISIPTLFVIILHPPVESAPCGLPISSPYGPTPPECTVVQENFKDWDWDGFPKTMCCRNALAVLSQALALHAKTSQGNGRLFLSLDEWNNCSTFELQKGMSMKSCGFEDIMYIGTSRCSSLSLQDLEGQDYYKNALGHCSHFDTALEDACLNCTASTVDLRNSLFQHFHVDQNNATERAICSLAAIISIAAAHLDDPSLTDKVFRCLPTLKTSNDSGYLKIKYSVAQLLFAIAIAIISLVLIILLVKHVAEKKPSKPVPLKGEASWSSLYRFSKAEIDRVINYDIERKCLGRGSAGQVYRGVLPSGQVVAIKHIYKSDSSDHLFTREVEGLSRVRHKHLVSLIGFCEEEGERYLVYEYCSGGNLAERLLRNDLVLEWDRRVKILRNCASALMYLHHHPEGCIVHRDIKLTNILLTEKLDPKLSDFGLAKMLGMEETKVFTEVRGTIGYMDPEYMTHAKLTCGSDIYSFGIVALQVLSGQKVFELDLDARDQLTRKAKDVQLGRRPLSDLEDPRLHGKLENSDFEAILAIAVLCVAKSSNARPSVDDIFEVLDNASKNIICVN